MSSPIKVFIIVVVVLYSSSIAFSQPLIINHLSANFDALSADNIINAKESLHIAYGHTSHGSQLITGMDGLKAYKGNLYSFTAFAGDDALDIRDRPFSGANDLGNPDRVTWESSTRTYLDKNPEINVIIWSWCGQVSSSRDSDIELYLSLMDGLESDYPAVNFVYMTGHLDGTGTEGNLNKRNEQIRQFCHDNDKILYDFADIESWNPDGDYFLDKRVNDNCDYDSNGDGIRDSNWAEEWQNAHQGEWYECSSAHSKALNANRKAYAAWQLWSALAMRMSPLSVETQNQNLTAYKLGNNFPNPFNGSTSLPLHIYKESHIRLSVYSSNGQHVKTITDAWFSPGQRTFIWNSKNDAGQAVSSGVYYFRLKMENNTVQSQKILYFK